MKGMKIYLIYLLFVIGLFYFVVFFPNKSIEYYPHINIGIKSE